MGEEGSAANFAIPDREPSQKQEVNTVEANAKRAQEFRNSIFGKIEFESAMKIEQEFELVLDADPKTHVSIDNSRNWLATALAAVDRFAEAKNVAGRIGSEKHRKDTLEMINNLSGESKI